MTVPLEQGLSMLRDSNDNIKLSIPISGTLDDPEFNFNDAIAQAIGKAMTMASLSYLKYTLQPFGTVLLVAELASEAGKAAVARLETVQFAPGSDELSDSARAYVDKLKTLLDERPQLSLTLCGVATGTDRQVLAGVGSKDKEATATAGKPATGVADKQPQTVVSDEALLDLARRRSAVVKGRFIAEHKIDASRLFNCHPQIDATADAAPGVTVSL